MDLKLKIPLLVAMIAMLGAGCASTSTIPMSVQSDPLGAFVVMKVRGTKSTETDWIYLGNTPIKTQRVFHKDTLKANHTLVLRLLKDGYIQQTKEWRGDELEEVVEDTGQLFWNPKLVDSD